MNEPKQPSADARRHRLLEGVLLRLARLPEADEFILRGGMLLRLWFHPLPRPAADLDLVATYPFGVEETERRFASLLADRGVDDGVTFDPERFRAEGIWVKTDFPGVRLFASGRVEGSPDDFSVDVTFGEPLVPAPEPAEYALAASPPRLRMCRPETIIGRKVHALAHMGMLHWRPKDLNDLRLLLGRVPLDHAVLPGAVAASFTSRGNTTAEARALFGPGSWWGLKMSRARWQDFVRESPGQEVPRDLAPVVAEVAERIGPTLERLP
jgi:hypothetical protein